MNQAPYAFDQVPEPRESCTVTRMGEHKRSALLFDRIWVQRRSEPFDAVDIPQQLTFGIGAVDHGILDAFTSKGLAAVGSPEWLGTLVGGFQRFVAETYGARGIHVVPSYSSQDVFAQEFPSGEFIAFQAALANIPAVSDSKLTWEQVLDFRQDQDSVRKYRDLRLWLRSGLKASSVGEATDIISKKIDDYEYAIKKHGLITYTGAISSVVSWVKEHPLLMTGGVAIAMAAPGGLLVSGLLAGANVSAWIAKRLIERTSLMRGKGSEIAILYDVKRKFGGLA